MSSFFYCFSLVWKAHSFLLTRIMILKILASLFPIIIIWLSQKIVNEIVYFQKSQSYLNLIIIFAFQVLIMILSFIIQQRVNYEEKRLGYLCGLDIKEKSLRKLSKLSFITLEDPSFYNQYQRLEDAQNRVLKMVLDVLNFVQNLIVVISVIIFLFNINWMVIPILVIGITPTFIIQMKFGSQRFFMLKMLTTDRRKEGYTSDLIRRRESLKEIKIYNLTNFLLDKWKGSYKNTFTHELRLQKKQNFWSSLSQIFLMLTYLSSGILIIYLIIKEKVLIGGFVAILQSIQRIQGSLFSIAQTLSGFNESSYLISELIAFFKRKEQTNTKQVKHFNQITRIDIKNLNFTYPNQQKRTIEDINFTVTPGKKIAIVGENGSGKTTLIKCLSGLYDTSNSIYINEVPIENINLEEYHDHLAVLFQDYNQYHFSAKENIGFGRNEDIDRDDLVHLSARETGIDEYLTSLTKGYSTSLGRLFDEGTDLSGGQWQKVALARLIFRRSDFIILDEPTASLDPVSEVEIIENLFKSQSQRSILFITHRLGAASLADEILVLKDGQIIESGTHNSLLELGGEYYKMFRTQSKWYTNNEKRGVL